MGSDFDGPEANVWFVKGQTLHPAEIAAALAEMVVDPTLSHRKFPPHHQAHGVDAGVHKFRRPPGGWRNDAVALAVAVVAGLLDVDVGIAADRVQDRL